MRRLIWLWRECAKEHAEISLELKEEVDNALVGVLCLATILVDVVAIAVMLPGGPT